MLLCHTWKNIQIHEFIDECVAQGGEKREWKETACLHMSGLTCVSTCLSVYVKVGTFHMVHATSLGCLMVKLGFMGVELGVGG